MDLQETERMDRNRLYAIERYYCRASIVYIHQINTGTEDWTINRQIEKYIESTEMWFIRRMMRIPCTARETNAEILIEANEQRHIIAEKTGKVYRSCSSKGEAGEHRNNTKNMWKTK
jgi:hypothetical protein